MPHVRDYQLQAADDAVILERAAAEGRVVVSADTDFATLLALQQSAQPSLLLLRWPLLRRPEDQAAVFLANLPAVSNDLERGSVVVIEETRVRVRLLPIGRTD